MKKRILIIVYIALTLCVLPAYSIIFPDFTTTDFGFKGPVKTVSSSSVSTEYFDDKGNPISSLIATYDFDKKGRAIKVTKDLEGTTDYVYDNQGHLTSVNTIREYGGKIIKLIYEGDKIVREERYRPDGKTPFSYSIFAYSPEGDLSSVTSVMVDKDKKETPEGSATFLYLGDTITMTKLSPKGNPLIIESYDKNRSEKIPTELTEYDPETGLKTTMVLNTFNPDGKITKTIRMDGNGRKLSTTEYKYDTAGNEILRSETKVDGTVNTVSTTRDQYGNPLIVTDSSKPKYKTTYTYTYY